MSLRGNQKLSLERYPEEEYGKLGTKKRKKNIAKCSNMRNGYGLTYAAYNAMVEAQDGKCAICETTEKVIAKRHGVLTELDMAVDHCHETGQIRAVLCHKCNRGLGLFLDSPELLRAAADYLDQHSGE